jgi:hypothetical protein
MGEFFLILGLLFLTAFIFVAWLIVRVATLIVRGLFGLGRRSTGVRQTLAAPPMVGWSHCRHPGCREINPPHAQFCRRCGSSVVAAAAPTDLPRMRYVA